MWRALVVLKIISEDKVESTFRFAHVHLIVTDNLCAYIIYVARW